MVPKTKPMTTGVKYTLLSQTSFSERFLTKLEALDLKDEQYIFLKILI